jgi:hypothetical protein
VTTAPFSGPVRLSEDRLEPMDGEDATRLAHKTVELVEAMAFRALELPSGERADFVTHHIARLRALKQFPDRFLDRLDGYVRLRIAEIEAAGGSVFGTA